jgi:hypothetical protein
MIFSENRYPLFGIMLGGGGIIMLFSMQFLGRLAALAHDYRPGQRGIGSNIFGGPLSRAAAVARPGV